MSRWRFSARGIWRALGPGLVTGAADDDPSGIATYSQAGAQFGYSLLWTVFLTLPFMAAIQVISAVIGWNTRQGLARNIAKVLPGWALYPLVASLLVANTINIAADLAAMGEALRLVAGGSALLFAVLFGIVCLIAEVLIPYHRYAGYLKLLTMVLLFYVAAAFSVHIPWGEVAQATLVPKIDFSRDELLMIVAVFGTTISPYLFFWQASQEAEESRLSHRHMFAGQPDLTKHSFKSISIDTWTGMFFFQRNRLFHHRNHGGHAAQPRCHPHRYGGAGRRGLASDRRAAGLRAFCLRNHRHRPAGGADIGRIGRLRGCRSVQTARQSGVAGQPRHRLLCDRGGSDVGRLDTAPDENRPDRNAVLDRGDQRHCRGADHDRDHGGGFQQA